MTDAQHTQEKEALEDATNRLLYVNGLNLGTVRFTEVGMWETQDGGKIAGPGYTVTFTASAALLAALAGQSQPPPVSPPPPPPPPPPVSPPPPPPPQTDDYAGALAPGESMTPPADA